MASGSRDDFGAGAAGGSYRAPVMDDEIPFAPQFL
jgi:hypothetical protein